MEIAQLFHQCGFKIVATGATCDTINAAGIPADKVKKLYEGRPNIQDMITNGEIQFIVNTPAGKSSVNDDSYLRKAAVKGKIPYMTTMAAARVSAKGILYVKNHGKGDVHSLQGLHETIRDKQ